jgi:SAM-dependent methyltransferase
MPPEEMWHSFFDPTVALLKLGLSAECDCVVDFGCGYGTFSIPAARFVQGTVHSLDIEPSMVATVQSKGVDLPNLKVSRRDFIQHGCGLPSGAADYVMLFNILHALESGALLAEARRVLKKDGKLAVMHWNYDPSTPRGPSMNIRLRPEQCQAIVREAGFNVEAIVDLPPYHYGFVAQAANVNSP